MAAFALSLISGRQTVMVPDSYPLPRVEDCVDTLGTAKYVSKLDLQKGYWQVPLTARVSEISEFVTDFCSFFTGYGNVFLNV